MRAAQGAEHDDRGVEALWYAARQQRGRGVEVWEYAARQLRGRGSVVAGCLAHGGPGRETRILGVAGTHGGGFSECGGSQLFAESGSGHHDRDIPFSTSHW